MPQGEFIFTHKLCALWVLEFESQRLSDFLSTLSICPGILSSSGNPATSCTVFLSLSWSADLWGLRFALHSSQHPWHPARLLTTLSGVPRRNCSIPNQRNPENVINTPPHPDEESTVSKDVSLMFCNFFCSQIVCQFPRFVNQLIQQVSIW